MQAHGERIKSTTHQAESIPGTHVWIRPLQKLLPPEVLNASPCLSSSRCSKDSMQGVVPDSILRDAAYDGHEFLKPAGNVTILTLSPRLYADSFFMALLSHFLQVQAFTLHPLDFELQKRLTRRLCHTHKHTYTHTHTHPDTYTPRHIHTQTHTSICLFPASSSRGCSLFDHPWIYLLIFASCLETRICPKSTLLEANHTGLGLNWDAACPRASTGLISCDPMEIGQKQKTKGKRKKKKKRRRNGR
jgi:hypothetical protein